MGMRFLWRVTRCKRNRASGIYEQVQKKGMGYVNARTSLLYMYCYAERDRLLFMAARMVVAADFLRSERILDWNAFLEKQRFGLAVEFGLRPYAHPRFLRGESFARCCFFEIHRPLTRW